MSNESTRYENDVKLLKDILKSSCVFEGEVLVSEYVEKYSDKDDVLDRIYYLLYGALGWYERGGALHAINSKAERKAIAYYNPDFNIWVRYLNLNAKSWEGSGIRIFKTADKTLESISIWGRFRYTFSNGELMTNADIDNWRNGLARGGHKITKSHSEYVEYNNESELREDEDSINDMMWEEQWRRGPDDTSWY